jgi:8-oxo-dGTP pyrophosphatase MutT (NUDIX family)
MGNNLNTYLKEITKTPRAGIIPYVKHKEKYYIPLMIPSDPLYGGTEYQLAKGVIEKNDTAIATAIKECQQELGLNITNTSLKLLWNNKKSNIQWFFCELKEMSKMIPEPNEDGIIETKDPKWFDLYEAEQIIKDWQKPLIKVLKRRLGI